MRKGIGFGKKWLALLIWWTMPGSKTMRRGEPRQHKMQQFIDPIVNNVFYCIINNCFIFRLDNDFFLGYIWCFSTWRYFSSEFNKPSQNGGSLIWKHWLFFPGLKVVLLLMEMAIFFCKIVKLTCFNISLTNSIVTFSCSN